MLTQRNARASPGPPRARVAAHRAPPPVSACSPPFSAPARRARLELRLDLRRGLRLDLPLGSRLESRLDSRPGLRHAWRLGLHLDSRLGPRLPRTPTIRDRASRRHPCPRRGRIALASPSRQPLRGGGVAGGCLTADAPPSHCRHAAAVSPPARHHTATASPPPRCRSAVASPPPHRHTAVLRRRRLVSPHGGAAATTSSARSGRCAAASFALLRLRRRLWLPYGAPTLAPPSHCRGAAAASPPRRCCVAAVSPCRHALARPGPGTPPRRRTAAARRRRLAVARRAWPRQVRPSRPPHCRAVAASPPPRPRRLAGMRGCSLAVASPARASPPPRRRGAPRGGPIPSASRTRAAAPTQHHAATPSSPPRHRAAPAPSPRRRAASSAPPPLYRRAAAAAPSFGRDLGERLGTALASRLVPPDLDSRACDPRSRDSRSRDPQFPGSRPRDPRGHTQQHHHAVTRPHGTLPRPQRQPWSPALAFALASRDQRRLAPAPGATLAPGLGLCDHLQRPLCDSPLPRTRPRLFCTIADCDAPAQASPRL